MQIFKDIGIDDPNDAVIALLVVYTIDAEPGYNLDLFEAEYQKVADKLVTLKFLTNKNGHLYFNSDLQ